ncbi:hypothetical protein [Sulfuriferula plumbiphila]|uniref:hypothetical protein n=1 Tax=Sulfuriferula plumbiphila TaxID=171865 RepID=UPI001CB8E582|nr:hypothetical protein [Sulfuriferula plumbiphila]
MPGNQFERIAPHQHGKRRFGNGCCGNEGVLGVPIFMVGQTALTQATVPHSGHACRLKSLVLKEVFLIPWGLARVRSPVQSACRAPH